MADKDFESKVYAKLSPINEPKNWCIMEWDDGIEQLNETCVGSGFIFQKVRLTEQEFEVLPEHQGW